MAKLALEAQFADPDAAYRLISEAHRKLDAAESAALNARLVLVLANHVGNMAVLREAVKLASLGIASHDPAIKDLATKTLATKDLATKDIAQ